jgi:ferredoxin
MPAPQRSIEHLAWRVLSRADAGANRLYGWRGNPLYQSGTIVVALLAVLLVTGLWLLLFYRVGSPYASVAGITSSLITGNWVRGLHRYASDAALVATGVHMLRMFAQGRSWGPRTLAWVSGVALLALLFICGWTGYVMVWDVFGQALAHEGARMLDALPVLSEPVSRAFTGERPVANAFFFVNLFAHVALPLGLAVGLWIHASRVARANLLPPRPLMWSVIGILTAAAIVQPIVMDPPASAFAIAANVRGDLFYAFWLPISKQLHGGLALGIGVAALVLMALVPLVTRRASTARPAPSHVDQELCVGCEQCAADCPYEAIAMVPRTDPRLLIRSDTVAEVDPTRCVSCGICAGSCAPMGVGPPGRTGRNQLADTREFLRAPAFAPAALVVVCCDRTSEQLAPVIAAEGAVMRRVDCAGSLHTSVIELLVRAGARGVLILGCPPRDCWNREGPKWLAERVYHDREAELQARVDRRRVRIAHADIHDAASTRIAIRAFAASLEPLDRPSADPSLDIAAVCEPPAAEPVR